MNIEREIKVRDAIKYCIENFDSQTATNRIVEFWKDELKLQEQQLTIPAVVGRSEQLKAFLRWAENEWMETPPERQWEQMFDEYFKSL